jgi:non-heme chloroperoxidase
MAADVVAFLDALGIRRATLVGHSYGTFVARQVTIAWPARIAALVLIGTGWRPLNPVTHQLQASLQDLPDPIPVEFARAFQSGTAHSPLPPDFFERIVAESLKLPPHLWRLTIDRLLAYDDSNLLDRIAAPALLLWGDRDGLFPRVDQEQVVSAMRRARLTVYEETGHCPNWERPELVAADIAAFIGEI